MKLNISKKRTIYFKGKNTVKNGSLCLNNKNSNLKLLNFEYIRLKASRKIFKKFENHETVIVLLKGKCLISTKSKKYILGHRKDVFSAKSHSLFIPPEIPFFLDSLDLATEISIITTPVKYNKNKIVKEIADGKIRVQKVGKGIYERKVHTLIGPDFREKRSHLLVGETFNKGGKWSSFPPHKHMRNNLPNETRYEEIYFFKVNPSDKFGFIRIYNQREDNVYCIKDNDCAIVTDGYHPVCAVPGSTVYYLWAMVGKSAKVINNYDNSFHNISM